MKENISNLAFFLSQAAYLSLFIVVLSDSIDISFNHFKYLLSTRFPDHSLLLIGIFLFPVRHLIVYTCCCRPLPSHRVSANPVILIRKL